MKKLKRLALQFTTALVLAGCSWSPTTKMVTFLGGTVVVGAVLMKGNKKKSESKIINVNPDDYQVLTGAVDQLGGMLYDSKTVLHVAHWPIKPNQNIKLKNTDGVWVNRTIVRKTVIANNEGEGDLALLTLNKSIYITKHEILPIFKVKAGDVVTIYRLRRGPFKTEVSVVDDASIKGRAGNSEDSAIESGDSGKAWITTKDGVRGIVSLTSRGYWGRGPNLHKFKAEIKATVDQLAVEFPR